MTGKAAAWRELRNRWGVYAEVRVRGLGRRFGPRDLAPEIERIERRNRFAALWGIENLGYRYAESERRRGEDPRRLFAVERIGELPERALPMLHAGAGLSLFRHALGRVTSQRTESSPESADPSGASSESPVATGDLTSPESADPFRREAVGHGESAVAVARFLRETSRPGHVTAAVECLGLITRFFHPNRVREVAESLAGHARWAVEPFWHGLGRCQYFLPAEMLPRRRHWRRMLDRVEREAPPVAPRANALAGLAWALVLVNQRHPAVLEAFLGRHGDRLDAGWRDDAGNEATARGAFASGVATACAVREQTSPGHPVGERFLSHRPASPALARRWRELVVEPARWGIGELLPRLAAEGRVSDLCRYHPPFQPGKRRSA